MLFINTRPSIRATSLTHTLQNHGMEVVELPLLEMSSLTLSANDTNRLQTLLSANQNNDKMTSTYDLLVVVSPTAAEKGCQLLSSVTASSMSADSKQLADSPLTNILPNLCPTVAVGQATANKLVEFGISATLPSMASNEGMLALECIDRLNPNSRVMIWRGQGGRALLIDSLRQRGVQVDVLELYQRQLPKHTQKTYQQWITPLRPYQHPQPLAHVLISSAEAFSNWKTIVNNGSPVVRLDDFYYLALGQRLSQILDQEQLSHQTIDTLSASHILTALITEPDI